MKKFVLCSALLCLIAVQSFGQARTRYQEYGFGVGTLNSTGDIATTTKTAALLDELRPNFMAFGQYHFNDWFTMGMQVSYGWLYMDDNNHTNPNRGITNSTNLVQANPYLQMHLIRFGKYHTARKFTSYVKLGLGFIAYDTNPQASRIFSENTIEYPAAYSGFNTFYGLGVKIRTSTTSTLSLEATFHNTYSDKFDGISAPSTSENNDRFGGLTLKYGFLIL